MSRISFEKRCANNQFYNKGYNNCAGNLNGTGSDRKPTQLLEEGLIRG